MCGLTVGRWPRFQFSVSTGLLIGLLLADHRSEVSSSHRHQLEGLFARTLAGEMRINAAPTTDAARGMAVPAMKCFQFMIQAFIRSLGDGVIGSAQNGLSPPRDGPGIRGTPIPTPAPDPQLGNGMLEEYSFQASCAPGLEVSIQCTPLAQGEELSKTPMLGYPSPRDVSLSIEVQAEPQPNNENHD